MVTRRARVRGWLFRRFSGGVPAYETVRPRALPSGNNSLQAASCPPRQTGDGGFRNCMHSMLTRCCLACIRAYQLFLSPLIPPSCRFTPTCSAYAREAILAHGVGRGLRMAVSRLLRCHPWGGSGYDPVP